MMMKMIYGEIIVIKIIIIKILYNGNNNNSNNNKSSLNNKVRVKRRKIYGAMKIYSYKMMMNKRKKILIIKIPFNNQTNKKARIF